MPEKILSKPPADGLGGQTDEEKMGIKYAEIEEMIETGSTNEKAKEKILKMYNNSKHKREKASIYKFERTNMLEK